MTGDQKERTNTVKITEVIPHVLIGKTAPYSTWASDFVDVRYSMVVEIRTDEGITGWENPSATEGSREAFPLPISIIPSSRF